MFSLTVFTFGLKHNLKYITFITEIENLNKKNVWHMLFIYIKIYCKY